MSMRARRKRYGKTSMMQVLKTATTLSVIAREISIMAAFR